MISSLIVTVILIIAGLFLFWQLYDAVRSETGKMLILIAYLLLVLILLFKWFADYIITTLTM